MASECSAGLDRWRILVVLPPRCTQQPVPETCFQGSCWISVSCRGSRVPFMASVFLFR